MRSRYCSLRVVHPSCSRIRGKDILWSYSSHDLEVQEVAGVPVAAASFLGSRPLEEIAD
jgi:hypothetical protein